MEGVLWRSPHDARKLSLPDLHKQSGCKCGAHQGRVPRTCSRTVGGGTRLTTLPSSVAEE